MRILRNNTQGLIIDIQEKLFPHIYDYLKIEKNTEILIQGLQILDIPVIVSEQYTKGLGFTVPAIRNVLGEVYKPMEKSAFSCCDDHEINLAIQSDKKFIIIAGIEAHVCVLQTCIDLLEKDYQPVIVSDCISSRKLNDKDIAVTRMKNEGAIITTYESLLFEMARYSGTSEFKEISKLVK